MYRSIFALISLFLLVALSAPAQITQNGAVSWMSGATPGTYHAAASDKLVVVVTGEHGYPDNYTGNCTAVSYNGQALVKAVGQLPVNPAQGGHGQTHSSIWYLDNPGNYSGAGTIQVTCIGGSFVATAIGLSGTQPGVGPTAAVSKANTCNISTTGYSSLIISALGMGGQGKTASPLPGVTAIAPAQAVTIAGLEYATNFTGHAVARANVTYPSSQTVTFNTAKTDVTTIAAVFHAANPAVPAGPVPTFLDIIPGQSVQLSWSNLLPETGSDVWVDLWLGDSATTLQKVVSADPAGLNLTTYAFTAPAQGIYHGRIDSYLNGAPTGTPYAGPAFTFEVSSAGLLAQTWTGLRPLATVLTLQREGIAIRPAGSTLRVAASGVENIPAGAGLRLRGFVTPQTTGAHVFHVSGSENCDLWISSTGSRFDKKRVAGNLGPTGVREWGKFSTQSSAPVELVAGTAYYIEARCINTAGFGHLDIGWSPPGATAPAPIPVARLTCQTVDPADSNNNDLPDTWEQSTGLDQSPLPGANTQDADPDRDGVVNLDEYQLGTDPLEVEEIAGRLTRETWSSLTGQLVSDLVTNARFHDLPNEIVPTPGIDQQSQLAHYGTRHRGFLVAPATGTYRFWITGADEAELWLADATITPRGEPQPRADRFGKRLIARNTPTSATKTWHWPNPYQFDLGPTQRSAAIHLIQGQAYYIEALQKRYHGTIGHVAVAWQAPGQARALLPGNVLLADLPHAADLDNDFLPDTWQSTKGLVAPTYTAVQRGQFGDPDTDGLINLLEYQHGTNPLAADTDGDGLSDKSEVDYYHTDPLVPNTLAPAMAATPVVQQYIASGTTGGWTANANGSLSAMDRRGAITYAFTLAEPGVHEITVTGAAIGTVQAVEHLPLVLSLDGGSPFASGKLVSTNGGQGSVKGITPWLTAGSHTLTILHDNYRTARQLRIDAIQIKRLGGQDLNENGIPDWIEQNAQAANALSRVPTQSRTSPASIEGITENLATAALTFTPYGASQGTPVVLHSSINNSFFADVPLSEDGPVVLAATFLSGFVPATANIEWIPTNVFGSFSNNTLHIRQGDSLRLTAHDPAQSPSGTFTLQGSAGVPPAPSEPRAASDPLVLQFTSPGTHTLTASWTPDSGPVETAALTVVVHAADFGPAFIVSAYSARTWTPPVLDTLAQVEADERIVLQEITTTGARSFTANVREAGNRHVIARLPSGIDGAPSAILARGTLHGVYLARVDETQDAAIVTRYPDGTWLMRTSFVAVNFPPGLMLRITTGNQGTLFTNGSNVFELRASDFDANGIATVYYEWAGTGDPRLCHNTQLFLENQ